MFRCFQKQEIFNYVGGRIEPVTVKRIGFVVSWMQFLKVDTLSVKVGI